MFEHIRDVALPIGVIAPFSGNLSVCWLDTRNITYAALSQHSNVHIANWDNKTDSEINWETINIVDEVTDRPVEITAVGLVHPNARNFPVVIVGSTTSVQIYDVKKNVTRVMFQISLESILKEYSVNKDVGAYCKGISCNDNTVLVGTHSGEIMMLMCNGESNFSSRKTLKEHKTPVADIATCRYDEITCSASGDGEIIVWQKPVKAVSIRILTKHPINIVNVLRKHVIVGTLRGIIQFYSVLTGDLACQIHAHARPISSISVAPESAYILSASEDSQFFIYKLHTRKPHPFQAEHRFGMHLPDKLIVGAQFTNGRGSSVAVASYDQTAISMYKIKKLQAPLPAAAEQPIQPQV
ncbi:unnamed protein product [Caenorhabditis angaria]|uniref:WD repeat-containing protein 54 beta-propeller domain-containing protein n=1 Tax=Caenorhabditis angaria TaxID=860376 RepID=A0A9P1J6M3_9PELO|nr:unnamed protein product [Caenorhabditis angaria]